MKLSFRILILVTVVTSLTSLIIVMRARDSSILQFDIRQSDTFIYTDDKENDHSYDRALQQMTSVQSQKVKGTSPKKLKLILLTYMRSGSSLTGDLLQKHPSVFYVYEPLWMTENFYKGIVNEMPMKLLNDTDLMVPKTSSELYNMYLQVIDHFLSCQLEEIDASTLTQYHMIHGRYTRKAYNCSHYLYRRYQASNRSLLVTEAPFLNSEMLNTRLCLKPMFDNCERSEVTMVKVIRFSMDQAKVLMTADSNVKVIHLLRDPRGTLKSQSRVGMFKLEEEKVAAAARKFCHKLQQDFVLSKVISKLFPARVLTVRYEDITQSPIEATREMYRFMGLQTNADIEDYIWSITYSGKPNDCSICTTRNNATQTANKWRKSLSFQNVVLIQNECKDIFDIMGYRVFRSEEELRNESLSAHLDIYSDDLYKVKVTRAEDM